MSSGSSNHPANTSPGQYAQLTWGPLRGFVMVVVSFVVGQGLGIAVVLLLAAGYSWITGASGDNWLTSTQGDFWFTFFIETLSLGILFLFLRKRRATLAMIGFMRKPRWLDPAYALIGWAAYFIVLVVVSQLVSQVLSIDTGQKQDLGFHSVASHLDLVLTFISLVVLPPVVEEILFRGVLFGGLRKRLSFVWSALITSVFFGALHLNGGETGGGALWIAGIDTLLLSFVLCYLREHTGSIWASIGLHMLKNSIAYLYLFVFVT